VRIATKRKREKRALNGMRKLSSRISHLPLLSQFSIRMHDKERGRTMKINEPKTPYVDSLSDVEGTLF